MYKVKKCPCCSNIDNVKIKTKFIQNGLCYRVLCDDSDGGCGLRTAWYRNINDAVNNWNRRADSNDSVRVGTNERI